MRRRAALAALTILLQILGGRADQCSLGSEDVRGRGAGNGGDDFDAFAAVEGDGSAGVIYMPLGTYRVARSLTLKKPILAVKGAVFQVEGGVTLRLENQPQHPDNRFFTGAGTVVMGTGVQFVKPEWFGARGDGRSDDSAAIQKAYDAIKAGGNAILHLSAKYGIGPARALEFGPGVVISSKDTAKFIAVDGNSRGVYFTPGNHGPKVVLPHLVGFSDYCVQFQGVALAAVQLKTLVNCGDAIRYAATGVGMGSGVNTIWFDKIVNSRVGIAFRAYSNDCTAGNCVLQGSQFVGNVIQGGPGSGPSYAILFDSPLPDDRKPGWDSNVFDIKVIVPPNNPDYRVFHSNPSTDRQVVRIGSLGALPHPASRVFGSSANNAFQIDLTLNKPLKEDQLGLMGQLNVVNINGAVTPKPTTAVRCTTAPNSKSAFNGGRALVGNFFKLQLVPDWDWQDGQVREFYIYTQQANGFLYELKCNADRNSLGLPQFDCPQYNDNAWSVPGEVKLWILNQSGRTVGAGQAEYMTIAINTLANPKAAS